MPNPPQACELCHRQVSHLTTHHLIPKTRHNNRRVRRDLDRQQVRQALARLCRSCHNFLHATFTEKTLERELNTLTSISHHPKVAAFLLWLKTKPSNFHAYTREAQQKH